MKKISLKGQLPEKLLNVSEKCVSSALIAAGAFAATTPVSAAVPSAVATATVTAPAIPAADVNAPGAILLSIVHTDPATGEQIAQHYSHASHDSHASHASHYSSRP